MKTQVVIGVLLLSVVLFVSADPVSGQAPPPKRPHAGHYIGSVLLSIFHVPFKIVTCTTGQVLGGAAYVMTNGVPGNYDGGTNGREIGEMASGSCVGNWIIRPKQLQQDYKADRAPSMTAD